MEGEIRVTELNELIKESRAKVEYHESKLIESRLQLLKQLIELKKTNIRWQTIKNGQN